MNHANSTKYVRIGTVFYSFVRFCTVSYGFLRFRTFVFSIRVPFTLTRYLSENNKSIKKSAQKPLFISKKISILLYCQHKKVPKLEYVHFKSIILNIIQNSVLSKLKRYVTLLLLMQVENGHVTQACSLIFSIFQWVT